jgi:hypothetical protein
MSSTDRYNDGPSTPYSIEGLVPDEPIVEEANNNNGSNRLQATLEIEDPSSPMKTGLLASENYINKESLAASSWKSLWKTVTQGGTIFDGFLLAASQEVGQSILTLPNIFAQLGFGTGLFLEVVFATMALYTNFLLVSLHAQYRHKLAITNDPRHGNKYYIASYHEVMESMVGVQLKQFSLVVVFFALLGLSTVQIIATSSNFYILAPGISKRNWSLVWGCIFSLIAFVSSYKYSSTTRHAFDLFSFWE